MTERMQATTGDLKCVIERIAARAEERARHGVDDTNELIGELANEVRASTTFENAGRLEDAARHSVEAAARAALIAMMVCLFAAHNPPKKVVH